MIYRLLYAGDTGSGMPDVTQLVPLADFYGVTVDTLLGRKDDAAEREVTEFIEKYNDVLTFAEEYSKEHSVTMREAFDVSLDEGRAMMKKYPNNYRLMIHVCYMLCIAPKECDWDESYWNARNWELVDLAEKILAECADSKIRNQAISELVFTYSLMNHYDKVKELAEMVPDMLTCRESVLCNAAEYYSEEHRTYSERYLKRCIMNVNTELRQFYSNPKKCPPEEILALTEMEWRIYHAYYDHGDFDAGWTCSLFKNRMHAARAALALGHPDDTVRVVSEALDMLAVSIASTSEEFTSSFLSHTGKRTPYPKVHDHKSIRQAFTEFAESDAVRDFRETAEFAALRRRLEEILG